MKIKATTRLCGLIGNPVEHSLSPFIQNELSEAMNTNMVYVTFKVENNLFEAIKGAYELNILGMNITKPWKEDVKDYLIDIDKLAEKVGAVNTLVRLENGFRGYNTDIFGFDRELLEEKINIKGNNVVIIGAGGAARAIAFLLASKGANKIYILNRTVEKAEIIANDVREKLDYTQIIPKHIDKYNEIAERDYIAIQTTNVGTYPHIDSAVLENNNFYKNALCGIDIVYNPATTKFMKLMNENGKKSYNGLKMLLYQGVAAFELWNNIKVPSKVINKIYDKLITLQENKKI